MTPLSLFLLLVSIFLSATAQLLLKAGMRGVGELAQRSLVAILPSVLTSPFILAGLACYGCSVLTWLLVLSKLEVSQAYPFVALGIVITTLGGCLILGESMNLTKGVGITVIVMGVILVARA